LMKTEGSVELAAAKTGMDAKTARKYRRLGRLPSELESPERWRTRPDPFAGVWESVQGLLGARGLRRRPCLSICSESIRVVFRTASCARCSAR